MKKTLLSLAGIGLLSAIFVYPAFSHNPGRYCQDNQMGPGYNGHGYQMGGGHHNGPWDEKDTLSSEQRGSLDKLHETFTADTKELRAQIHQKVAELNAVLAAPAPDSAKALKIQKEVNSLRNTMMEKRLTLEIEAKKIAPEALARNTFCDGPRAGRGHMFR
ncbi:MAG: periplasmic heavy metal sensor [Desulfobulbaceae bacterium]|nr:periplasmic heavy metal sensor [Desulfobulbaceae bacterium]